MMSRIYLASSWRNAQQPEILKLLRDQGHQVYDFRDPKEAGFGWAQIDPAWEDWTSLQYRNALTTALAAKGYITDFRAMEWADTCVLLLPCGRSAHIEAGYMAGRGKRLVLYSPIKQEPELMYLLANHLCFTQDELFASLS